MGGEEGRGRRVGKGRKGRGGKGMAEEGKGEEGKGEEGKGRTSPLQILDPPLLIHGNGNGN